MNGTLAKATAQRDVSQAEWRRNATMLLAATVCFACMSLPLISIGVLIKPLSAMYGWSRAEISASYLITAAGTMLIGPIAGHIVDRVGPRRVALIGLWMLGCGIAGIGFSGPSVTSWYIAWIIYAILQPFAGNVIWASAVTSRFDQNRGFALAIMLVGLSVTTSLVPILSVLVSEAFSWRAVFFLQGAFTVAIGFPLTLMFFYGAADLLRVNPDAGKDSEKARMLTLTGLTFGEAMRSRQFWQVAIAAFFAAVVVAVLVVHLQPILNDAGMTPEQAASVALVIGPATLAGRFISGFLLDRLPGQFVAAGVLIMPVGAYLILITYDGSMAQALLCAIFVGIAGGAEADLLAYLVSRYFGIRSFSVLYGLVLGTYSMGYGVAPVGAGAVYDHFRSYDPMFGTLLALAAAGALILVFLGPCPSFAERQTDTSRPPP